MVRKKLDEPGILDEEDTPEKPKEEIGGKKMAETAGPKKAKDTIRNHQDKKLFRCKNCSDADGDVYVSWTEAIKVDPKAERTLILCPYCKGQFGVYSLDNPIDVNFEPKNLKQGSIK